MRRVLVLGFIWGWSFLLIRVAVEGMTPITVAWARIAFGASALALMSRVQRLRVPRGWAIWKHFFAIGAMANAMPFTLLAWSAERVPSALVAVLNASTPLFTAAFAAALLAERLRFPQLTGLALGFVGVGVAAGVGGKDLSGSVLVGGSAAVGAAACYGIGMVYARRHLLGIDPLAAATGQLTAATILLVLPAILTTASSGIDLTGHRIAAVAILGVIGTGVAYRIFYASLDAVGATRTSLVTFLVPVVAVAVGVAFLDEPFRFRLLVGGALTGVGIALVQERLRTFRRVPMPGGALGLVLAVAVAGVTLGGCGDDGETASTVTTAEATTTAAPACGTVVDEPLDPNSTRHLLPGAPEPEYLTDPPTSGPHRLGDRPTGVASTPIERTVQVAILEEGGVVVQHREAEPGGLAELAGDHVVVAPNPGLSTAVVATAWTKKLECTFPDLIALRSFVTAYAGKGPGH